MKVVSRELFVSNPWKIHYPSSMSFMSPLFLHGKRDFWQCFRLSRYCHTLPDVLYILIPRTSVFLPILVDVDSTLPSSSFKNVYSIEFDPELPTCLKWFIYPSFCEREVSLLFLSPHINCVIYFPSRLLRKLL